MERIEYGRAELPPLIDPTVAYVKAIVIEGVRAYAIHLADGTQLAIAPSREVAFAAVRQHELEPASVH
jgi:hypothetical protein